MAELEADLYSELLTVGCIGVYLESSGELCPAVNWIGCVVRPTSSCQNPDVPFGIKESLSASAISIQSCHLVEVEAQTKARLTPEADGTRPDAGS
jgi:hypothetical protein